MNCNVKLYKDIFQLFDWFNRLEYSKISVSPIELSALSIYGTANINFEDKTDFLKKCSEIIKEIFNDLFTKFDYKLYLFVAIEVESPISKIAHYKKVWKGLSKEWDLSGFEFGPEMLVNINDKYHYVGLARFEIENLFTALEIQHNNIIKNFTFASYRDNFLSEEALESLYDNAFRKLNKLTTFHFPEESVDYFKLFAHYCTNQDVIFRIGDSAEDIELDAIFSESLYDELLTGNKAKFDN